MIRFLVAPLTALARAACGSADTTPDDAAGRDGVWMKGDLHLHSHHSRDALDNPMADLVDIAEARGMDFFVVTDHDNHVDGIIATWDDPDYRSEQMVLLYGSEFTTAKGHANTLSATRYDHRALYALRDAGGPALAARADELGVHLSANHPTNSDPWLFGYDGIVDSLEVWNALYAFPSDNRANLDLWDSLMEAGLRMPARGGSDCHHQQGIQPLGLNIGTPTTWVYAAERSAEAVIEAIARGRASISYAPGAERLILDADTDGDGTFETLMGDNAVATGESVRFRVRIDGFRALAGYTLDIVHNGAVVDTLRPSAPETFFTYAPEPGARHYYRVELNGSTPEAETLPAQAIGFYGRKVALSNPVHFGFAD